MKNWILGIFVLFLFSCLSEQSANKTMATSKPLNPNGDSELALLMRAMYDDGMEVKAQIENGETPQTNIDFKKILTATPTEENKTESPVYQSFATAYIENMKALKNSGTDEAHNLFVDMVNTCMSCHEQMCPGPTMKIKNLYPPKAISALPR